eukprot:TRINITY_DN93194_c0_g1_i1.p1 TRINITY_DN93194_c0_g1~~TRINITY_DN93194_c0_g1_i1.p1  ORF type:complete len:1378 (+),score=207.12 TRINITY_DN93194_c0_g1_i1:46-4179(+)
MNHTLDSTISSRWDLGISTPSTSGKKDDGDEGLQPKFSLPVMFAGGAFQFLGNAEAQDFIARRLQKPERQRRGRNRANESLPALHTLPVRGGTALGNASSVPLPARRASPPPALARQRLDMNQFPDLRIQEVVTKRQSVTLTYPLVLDNDCGTNSNYSAARRKLGTHQPAKQAFAVHGAESPQIMARVARKPREQKKERKQIENLAPLAGQREEEDMERERQTAAKGQETSQIFMLEMKVKELTAALSEFSHIIDEKQSQIDALEAQNEVLYLEIDRLEKRRLDLLAELEERQQVCRELAEKLDAERKQQKEGLLAMAEDEIEESKDKGPSTVTELPTSTRKIEVTTSKAAEPRDTVQSIIHEEETQQLQEQAQVMKAQIVKQSEELFALRAKLKELAESGNVPYFERFQRFSDAAITMIHCEDAPGEFEFHLDFVCPVVTVVVDIFGASEYPSSAVFDEMLHCAYLQVLNEARMHHGVVTNRLAVGQSTLIAAFRGPLDAFRFAIDLQIAFLNYAWPDEIFTAGSLYLTREMARVDGEDQLLWNGPQPRVGIHFGTAESRLDVVTERPTLYGSVVAAAVALAQNATGGEAIVSQTALDLIKDSGLLSGPAPLLIVEPVAAITAHLANPPFKMNAYRVVPKLLELRLSRIRQVHNSSPPRPATAVVDGSAPAGDVFFVMAKVQGVRRGNELDLTRPGIRDALAMCLDLLVGELALFEAYCTQRDRDHALAVFRRADKAVLWSLRVQELLLKVKWPSAVLFSNDPAFQLRLWDKAVVFRGLRVRIGISRALRSARPVRDNFCSVMRYHEDSARWAVALGNYARGGEIVMTQHVYDAIRDNETLANLDVPYISKTPSKVRTAWHLDPISVYHAFPRNLAKRATCYAEDDAKRSRTELLRTEIGMVPKDLRTNSEFVERLHKYKLEGPSTNSAMHTMVTKSITGLVEARRIEEGQENNAHRKGTRAQVMTGEEEEDREGIFPPLMAHVTCYQFPRHYQSILRFKGDERDTRSAIGTNHAEQALQLLETARMAALDCWAARCPADRNRATFDYVQYLSTHIYSKFRRAETRLLRNRSTRDFVEDSESRQRQIMHTVISTFKRAAGKSSLSGLEGESPLSGSEGRRASQFSISEGQSGFSELHDTTRKFYRLFHTFACNVAKPIDREQITVAELAFATEWGSVPGTLGLPTADLHVIAKETVDIDYGADADIPSSKLKKSFLGFLAKVFLDARSIAVAALPNSVANFDGSIEVEIEHDTAPSSRTSSQSFHERKPTSVLQNMGVSREELLAAGLSPDSIDALFSNSQAAVPPQLPLPEPAPQQPVSPPKKAGVIDTGKPKATAVRGKQTVPSIAGVTELAIPEESSRPVVLAKPAGPKSSKR